MTHSTLDTPVPKPRTRQSAAEAMPRSAPRFEWRSPTLAELHIKLAAREAIDAHALSSPTNDHHHAPVAWGAVKMVGRARATLWRSWAAVKKVLSR